MIHPDHVKILSCSLAAGRGEKTYAGAGISRSVWRWPHLQKTRNGGGNPHLLQATVWSRHKPIVSICVRDNGNVCDSFRLTQTLVIKEKEGPVLADRPTDGKSKLVPLERRFSGSISVVLPGRRVESAVAEEFVHGSMKLIGAGLRHHVDNAAARTSILGTVISRQHLK